MLTIDCKDKFCVIGAGAAGLAASRALKRENIPFDVIESAHDVGGIWIYGQPGSPMYKNTHLIGHKKTQPFSDMPMPDEYPDYPNHQLVYQYLQKYASHFQLNEHIQFNTSVKKVEKAGNFWNVTLSNDETRCYRGVLIASGYHSKPNYPQFPGQFTGESLHSKEYDNPSQLSNKRVLVVGSGQSAMDIVVESAINAAKTFHSTRRGFLCMPKFLLGLPPELVMINTPIMNLIPSQAHMKFMAFMSPLSLFMQGINLKKYNIPFNCDSNGLIIPNSDQQIYRYYVHGDVVHKSNIKQFDRNRVIFEDGTEEEVDVIVYATGYKVEFSFIDKSCLNWEQNKPHPHLYLHVFHPHENNLFVIGMVHPTGTHWRVFEEQSKLVAAYIKAQDKKARFTNKFNALKNQIQNSLPSESQHHSGTHSLVIDKLGYMRQTQRLIRQLSV
ncbi:MAG: NAD(P)-binding domain-containing protein [Desmonostoc geniculatum HA4340-LM1]|jgi:cation diffusion facilitator CzcD-associated flavoprotein CzcO|nr:NAD(P)-binding domain-containing protein [Desmonostoc geniculatum HA4340-LM1]